PMEDRAQHYVEPVFPVTIAPGASLRILVRAQDNTIPTTVIDAWVPTAYTQALTWTLVGEAVKFTACLMLLGLLLWTTDMASSLLAGWLVVSVMFEASFEGQWLVYFLPSTMGHMVPVYTLTAAMSYLLFVMTSRVLLDIGRRGPWAWILGGLSGMSMAAACVTLFAPQHLWPRQVISTLGIVLILAWPPAAWQTPLPDRPGARALQQTFLFCLAAMAFTVWNARTGRPVQYAGITVICILLVYSKVRSATLESRRKHIEHLAFHDALTQMPNRVRGQQLLLQAMDKARLQGTSVGLLYLDLDKFKHVNDTYGHAVGDALLEAVAQRLQTCLGVGDTACRLSGDEFMAVMPSVCSADRVTRQCEYFLAQFSRPFNVEGLQLFISLSIGVARFPEHANDADTLMRRADTALFEAKRSGENGYRVFHPDMDVRLMAHISTRSALREALDRQEFELHYQPQINLARREVVGVEALIRWRRPGQALGMPGDFITVAEESGLIVPIGTWVLHAACQQAATWRGAGWHDLKMAVNVSPVQFQSGELVQHVTEALALSGLPPACLELELTESVLVGNEDEALRTVHQLKALGVGLSIDDFGTGYSSLSYLHRFRFDRIKIDRSFITGLGRKAEEQAIVRAIVQMARHLNLRTTAEGVEDAEVVERLAEIGCDEVQGFHYAQPLPADRMHQWRMAFQPVPA
ncbi:MAG: EAL domain-containing protein, partial [Sphaerotilus sp.]|nr:EAL domain-containing protein [Sphaerotilus sp.]